MQNLLDYTLPNPAANCASRENGRAVYWGLKYQMDAAHSVTFTRLILTLVQLRLDFTGYALTLELSEPRITCLWLSQLHHPLRSQLHLQEPVIVSR
jgi:hypothetical protein